MKRYFSKIFKKPVDIPKQMSATIRIQNALDSEGVGYLSKRELLEPINYMGVYTHKGLLHLI